MVLSAVPTKTKISGLCLPGLISITGVRLALWSEGFLCGFPIPFPLLFIDDVPYNPLPPPLLYLSLLWIVLSCLYFVANSASSWEVALTRSG